MDKLKKNRSVLRANITKLVKLLEHEEDERELETSYMLLEKKFNALEELDGKIYNLLLEQDVSEDDLLVEAEAAEEYSRKFYRAKVTFNNYVKTKENDSNSIRVSSKSNELTLKRKFKLPMLELTKFGGNIKDWLNFWSMFQKIDSDKDIVDEDKFQYLIQATVPGSRARQLVESFPPTANNYVKAVESLKSRFGREDLLIEMYIRELLGLIIQNLSSKTKLPLESLYDKIELQLRALESLKVTSDKCSAILYPLIESCLPEYLLRIWQRSGSCDRDASLKSQLDNLLTFLKKEVENEERVSMAVKSFDVGPDSMSRSTDSSKSNYKKEPLSKGNRFKSNSSFNETNVPTAHDLVNYQETRSNTGSCYFCSDTNHKSENCFKAKSLSLKEKQTILKKWNVCFSCLKAGHSYKRCRTNVKCNLCNRKHVTIMCFKDHQQTNESLKPKVGDSPQSSNGTNAENVGLSVENTLTNNSLMDVSLQTLVVVVRSERHERKVRALIDTGSQRSYILRTTAEEMSYTSVKQEQIVHSLFGGSLSQPQSHHVYKVRVKNVDETYACNFDVLDQDTICNEISPVKVGPWLSELKQSNVELSDLKKGPIELLIGADVAGKLITGRNLILKNGLVAMETLLGWTLMGKYPAATTSSSSSAMTVTMLLIKDFSVADLWSLDVLGIKDPDEKKTGCAAESRTMNNFLETVAVDGDGRYQVKLPWIEDHPPLPSNFKMAKKRLDILMNKLNSSGHFDSYQQVLSEWETKGIIERATDMEFDHGHYLPHRHVIKESSATTKLRPVFDASAKEKNQPSLNDCLEKGENLIELIPSILNRFRMHRFGVVADIEKAFLQIGVNPDDRDFLRFLWKDNEGELIVYRHARVVFGVTCSPFMLSAVIKLHLEQTLDLIETGSSAYSKDVVETLLRSFYVDNCMTSFNNFTDVIKFVNQSTSVMEEAKFCLRCWEFTEIESPQGWSKCLLTPVLGLNWNRQLDTLELNSEHFEFREPEIITKRFILSFAHKLFDPIGVTCPVALLPKILLQRTWESQIGWDEKVPDDIQHIFVQWAKELKLLSRLKIPRYFGYGIEGNISWTLHCFCDASQSAYAATVFIRGEINGFCTVQLVQSKSRVAPVKRMTIPRLELLAATIGARMTDSILKSMTLETVKTFYWSDSTTVLSWIRREDNWGVFVWNRVKEIRTLSKIDSWFHVPGCSNPADLPSRGCSPKQLVESRWWEGPQWLQGPPERWPNQSCSNDFDENLVNSERKKGTSTILLNAKVEPNDWYFRHFSRFEKIVRLLGWMLRFCTNSKMPVDLKNKGELTVDELAYAQKKVFMIVQKDSFSSFKDDKLNSLCPFEDSDGLIRIKTKLIERPDSKNFYFPVVLPNNHPVVYRFIKYKHEENSHVGVQGLLTILREEVWIICGRRTVKSVIDKCTVCKRYSVKRLDTAPVPLPMHRVRDASVFEVCGIDLAGPVFLREGQKAWIVLFTCAVYRAVHLELVTSLTTDSFLQSMRRFISRRGRPSMLFTDNGTNFQGAQNAFDRIDWNKIVEYSNIKRMKWKFNPPAAPWWGGWWERLIQILKQLLRRVLGRACLSYEELLTVLCDCESTINNRPLTYVSEDSNDMEVLTPAMFLNDIKEYGVYDIDQIEKTDMSRRLSYRLKLKEDLRKRFRNEYLSQMILHSKKKESRQVHIGEIVLIGSDNSKRIDWPLAKIQKTFPGKDGNVRLVELKTDKGILLRPVQRIYPLEVVQVEIQEDENNSKTLKQEEIHQPIVTRRGRKVKLPMRFKN